MLEKNIFLRCWKIFFCVVEKKIICVVEKKKFCVVEKKSFALLKKKIYNVIIHWPQWSHDSRSAWNWPIITDCMQHRTCNAHFCFMTQNYFFSNDAKINFFPTTQIILFKTQNIFFFDDANYFFQRRKGFFFQTTQIFFFWQRKIFSSDWPE